MSEYKTISAEEFADSELSNYTVIDLREPSDLLMGRVKGATMMTRTTKKTRTRITKLPPLSPYFSTSRVSNAPAPS